MRHSIGAWIGATRPHTFPLSVTPVVVTTAYMYWLTSTNQVSDAIEIDWLNAFLSLVGIISFQAAGNIFSDYYDFITGVDDNHVDLSKVLPKRVFTPNEFWYWGVALVTFGVGVGLPIAYRAGWDLLLMGVAAVIFAVGYSAFKYRALGDIIIFLSFSSVPILGTTFAITSQYYFPSLVLSVPVGFFAVALLLQNNIRDLETDIKAKIRTTTMYMSHQASVNLFAVYIFAPFLFIAVGCIVFNWFPIVSLMTFAALPNAFKCMGLMLAEHKKKKTGGAPFVFDDVTAGLELIVCALFSVSFIVDTLF